MMAKLSPYLRSLENGGLLFYCPGCKTCHSIKVEGAHAWTWNGDVNKPTFSPSIMVTCWELTKQGRAEMEVWEAAGYPSPREGRTFDRVKKICHSFVRDGQFQFLGDCTHSLANQMVELPPYFDADEY